MTPVGTHHGQHGDDCFACRVKTIQVSAGATPTRNAVRRDGRPLPGPKDLNNSWEKGILRDDHGVPIRMGGEVIPLAKYAQHRHSIDAKLKALRTPGDLVPSQSTTP